MYSTTQNKLENSCSDCLSNHSKNKKSCLNLIRPSKYKLAKNKFDGIRKIFSHNINICFTYIRNKTKHL